MTKTGDLAEKMKSNSNADGENEESAEIQLELESTIGFGGKVQDGLSIHPDRKHMVYPLGSTVVVRKIKDGSQTFFHGHTNTVSCVAVSKSGRFIASGQITHMGFQADIIIWDFEERKLLYRLMLHKVKVQALAFSPKDKYLVSLGGEDDNSLIVWDLQKGTAICGSPAAKESAGTALAVAYSNTDDNLFVTGGSYTLRTWDLDLANRKIRPTDCQLGQLKRVVKCIKVGLDDDFMFCGTTSGDVLSVNIRTRLFKHAGPSKDRFSMGVLAVMLTPQNLVVGTGDGTVAVLHRQSLKCLRKTVLEGSISSISMTKADCSEFYVGTAQSNLYKVQYSDLSADLQFTCHYSGINDITFPAGFSDLFATCSINDIRVWNAGTSKELLRITVPNLECHAVAFMRDGKSIISGWNDGKIRAFAPQSGKLMYIIHDAHNKGVTAISSTSNCKRIISGGGDGQIRIWRVTNSTQTMEGAMKEHKGAVSHIQIRKNDTECVSSSYDGSCIIWDLRRCVRNQVMFAQTMFGGVYYHPDESQVLTCGSDRKIGYWEVFDGSLIRELEGSLSGPINSLDISPNGEYFVTGGTDKLIKVWEYDEGDVTHVGKGHSGDIVSVKICPNQRHIVSVSSAGAVFRWKYPFPPKGDTEESGEASRD